MAQITTADVVRIHGKSRRQILRLVESGDLPYISKFPTATGGYLFDSDQVAKAFARLERERGPKRHERVAS